MTMRLLKKLLPFLFLILLSAGLCGCGEESAKHQAPATLEDFHEDDVTVGIIDGYIFEEVVESTLPYAQRKVFDDRESAYRALLTGQIDGVADDEATIRAMMRSTDAFSIVEGVLFPSDYGFVFPKNKQGEAMSAQMSAMIQTMRENGSLAALDEKWFGDDTSVKVSEDASSFPDLNGTVKFAYNRESIPFSYQTSSRFCIP